MNLVKVGAEVTGKKKCVGYLRRLKEIWIIRPT
jgi:hypothetical protein